jgi:hypothetical protein
MIAAAASLGLAILPLVSAGLVLILSVEPGRGTIAVSVAVAATLAAQTFAGLRLAAHALPKPRRNRLIAILLVRAPLLLVFVLGTMVLLVRNAGIPGGTYPGDSTWVLTQAAIALPSTIVQILFARAVMRIARGVSDERPAWKHLDIALLAISCLMAAAGFMTIVPFALWVLGPLLMLVCDALLFGSVAGLAGLHRAPVTRRGANP